MPSIPGFRLPKAQPTWESIGLRRRLNSPWFKLLDQHKFEQHVDRAQGLNIEVVAACHTPVIARGKIDEAFTMIRQIPQGDPPPQPGQPDLEALIHALATEGQYVWQPPAPNGGYDECGA